MALANQFERETDFEFVTHPLDNSLFDGVKHTAVAPKKDFRYLTTDGKGMVQLLFRITGQRGTGQLSL